MTAPTYPAEQYIDDAMAEARVKGRLDDECVDCWPEDECPACSSPGAIGCVKRDCIMGMDDILDRAEHLQEEAEYQDTVEEKREVAA